METNKQSPTLVLFDFDGTLTKGDTLIRFLFFSLPMNQLILGAIVLSIKYLGLLFSGKWTNGRAKALLLSTLFKGRSKAALEAMGAAFVQKKLPQLYRGDMMQLLREYRQSGAAIAIVSASADIWLKPFATEQAAQLICTELAYSDGVFMGELATPNCNGVEKARRIQAAFRLTDFEKIIAYGNSSGDQAMFQLAHESYRV